MLSATIVGGGIKISWDWVALQRLASHLTPVNNAADDLGCAGADPTRCPITPPCFSVNVHNTFSACIHCRGGPRPGWSVSLSLRHRRLIRSFVSQLRSLAAFLSSSIFHLTKTGTTGTKYHMPICNFNSLEIILLSDDNNTNSNRVGKINDQSRN